MSEARSRTCPVSTRILGVPLESALVLGVSAHDLAANRPIRSSWLANSDAILPECLYSVTTVTDSHVTPWDRRSVSELIDDYRVLRDGKSSTLSRTVLSVPACNRRQTEQR